MTLWQLAPDQQRMTLGLAAARRKRRGERAARIPEWRSLARLEQTPPDGEWHAWYIRGGRGSGKTWTGSHTLAEWPLEFPGEYAAVGPTYADARDTCIEGRSGLLAAYGTNRVEVDAGLSPLVASWNRSMGDLRLRNGSVIFADGADDGAPRIQGKNLRGLWADEVGLWKNWRMAWEESIRYAVRLQPARKVITGTPKRGHGLVKALMADAETVKTWMRTMDNAANLDEATLADWMRLYAGTTLGRQELEGEILSDVPGALWHRDMIDVTRRQIAPDLRRIVVAIDPSATSTESADEAGIVVAGIAGDHGYVLADYSQRCAPIDWANIAIEAFRTWKADRIVAETNNGGEMVETVIRTVNRQVPYTAVTASRGKQTRAEPISALYEQGRIHHVGAFEALEDQMCSWVPGEKSPDRMDALVWALTDLMVQENNPWASLGGKTASAVA